MTEAEAFAAIALAAVAADGKIRQDEASALRKVLEHRRLFREMSEQAMGNLSIELMQSLESDGVRGLMDRALLKLSPDLQESALAVAAHLVYSDRWESSSTTWWIRSSCRRAAMVPQSCVRLRSSTATPCAINGSAP